VAYSYEHVSEKLGSARTFGGSGTEINWSDRWPQDGKYSVLGR
jgi:hypothetical protein